jgi:hypothetical protein
MIGLQKFNAADLCKYGIVELVNEYIRTLSDSIMLQLYYSTIKCTVHRAIYVAARCRTDSPEFGCEHQDYVL